MIGTPLIVADKDWALTFSQLFGQSWDFLMAAESSLPVPWCLAYEPRAKQISSIRLFSTMLRGVPAVEIENRGEPDKHSILSSEALAPELDSHSLFANAVPLDHAKPNVLWGAL